MRKIIITLSFFFLIPFTVFADTFNATVSPTTASDLTGINITDNGNGWRMYLLNGDRSAFDGVSFGTNAATVATDECGHLDSYTGTAEGIYTNGPNQINCPSDSTTGVWTLYETDTGGGHNAIKLLTIGGGGGGGSGAPSTTEATSSNDQSQQNYYNGAFLMILSMLGIVWLLK